MMNNLELESNFEQMKNDVLYKILTTKEKREKSGA